MSIIYEERLSDSPYVESITHGHTASDGASLRPAECHWHMVLVRQQGNAHLTVVGPWTQAGTTAWTEGAELLWIKFKLGTWMPGLPTSQFLDTETILPEAAHNAFWLHGSAWQFPDYEHADTFVDRLVRADLLRFDPLVHAALHDQPHVFADRTVRHRFLRATGLTQKHIQQMERARQVATRLRHGVSIPDAMFEGGYFDQPHLTRSLKRWIGYTPAHIARLGKPT